MLFGPRGRRRNRPGWQLPALCPSFNQPVQVRPGREPEQRAPFSRPRPIPVLNGSSSDAWRPRGPHFLLDLEDQATSPTKGSPQREALRLHCEVGDTLKKSSEHLSISPSHIFSVSILP